MSSWKRILGPSARMLRELQSFEQRFPFIGLVQGSGLFMRVELVNAPTVLAQRLSNNSVRVPKSPLEQVVSLAPNCGLGERR